MLLKKLNQYNFFKLKYGYQSRQKNPKYFHNPLVEGQYSVTPARKVPSNIIRPSYMIDKKPIFGIYEGPAVTHGKNMIEKLRKAASIAAKTAQVAQRSVKKGMTTDELDKIVHDYIISQNAYPSPIGFMGFPKSVCTSVNEVCCHGIPNLRPLQEGDSLNIDVTIFYDGVHGDTSVMAQVPKMNQEISKLIETTQKALYEAIKICKPGQKFNQIGKVIQEIANNDGYYVSEVFTGHGIGELMHMPPTIFHTLNHYPGVMVPGNVFTIEPILLMKDEQDYKIWNDNFTVISTDNPSAQWEHMILITENGYEVLTKRDDELEL
ncbi:unnamed protein product [Paramecium pentaurelia]|uniref:Peptidase M24 domain-containing protein n=1 Tax=Paramecium pentaurelia TaxID=43138 RepID=A0A8S1SWT5_9CILI|nr:unnamed protein product [Paramecium pentaurelia]